jgi:cation diffusion facilitator CzcD-associated flavoprotein CzcO
VVETNAGTFHSHYLLAATGGHNRPFIPSIQRKKSAVTECHAFGFTNPAIIRGRNVIVVGGGASAYDLLDQCFKHHAAKVTWVYRSLRWMRPSLMPKNSGTGMRRLAQVQMLGVPMAILNRLMNRRLRRSYLDLGLGELIPEKPFDLSRDQILPGRRTMLLNFARIERHPGEIGRIEGKVVHLKNGRHLEADMLLWGTGYEMDLGYLDVEPLAHQTRLGDVASRCGSLFRALDAPNLFLLAPGVLDTNGSTPWAYAHAAKSIVAHVKGREVFGTRVAKTRAHYFDLARFLAVRDRPNYPWGKWRITYFRLAFLWNRAKPLPLP